MSATIVTPGMSLQRIADRDEARREELHAVLRQQHHVGRAAELVADVGRGVVAEHLAGQILRRIEDRRRRRRHHGADIGARPDRPAAAPARAPPDRPAASPPRRTARATKSLDLPRLQRRDRCRRPRPRRRARDPSAACSRPVPDALDELAVVVLREAERLLEPGRHARRPAQSRRTAAARAASVMPCGAVLRRAGQRQRRARRPTPAAQPPMPDTACRSRSICVLSARDACRGVAPPCSTFPCARLLRGRALGPVGKVSRAAVPGSRLRTRSRRPCPPPSP